MNKYRKGHVEEGISRDVEGVVSMCVKEQEEGEYRLIVFAENAYGIYCHKFATGIYYPAFLAGPRPIYCGYTIPTQ